MLGAGFRVWAFGPLAFGRLGVWAFGRLGVWAFRGWGGVEEEMLLQSA